MRQSPKSNSVLFGSSDSPFKKLFTFRHYALIFKKLPRRSYVCQQCATNNFFAETLSLMSGFCSSAIVEQHAAAGSPDPLRFPTQYSFPG